jgi:hypothetical protein
MKEDSMADIYAIRDTRTKKIVQSGFEKKQDAKVVRNEMNAKDNKKGIFRYVITPGKDHLRYA